MYFWFLVCVFVLPDCLLADVEACRPNNTLMKRGTSEKNDEYFLLHGRIDEICEQSKDENHLINDNVSVVDDDECFYRRIDNLCEEITASIENGRQILEQM